MGPPHEGSIRRPIANALPLSYVPLCVNEGHSQRECSPLHRIEVPTYAGDSFSIYLDENEQFLTT